jgi:protein involved in polysaccharide export with SLBB domain
LERAVSGTSYRLGPGDGLTVAIWAPEPVRYDLAVNLEGKLLIPTVGELEVDGLLLQEAKERIRQAVLQRFHDVEVTVSLSRLRRFQVHVLGEVQRPGTYVGTAVDRVSAAVSWAGGLTEEASQRRILVVAGDSIRARADLFLFLHRGNPQANPWLRDGDIIYVPFAKEHFSVKGAVNAPDDYEFLPGDRFSDALFYAGGLRADAFPDTIEIARYPGPNRPPIRFYAVAGGELIPAEGVPPSALPPILGVFRLEETGTRPGRTVDLPDFELRANDIVFVRFIPEARIKKLVEVRGEVVYPGFYAIEEGRTRLSEVIQRAGGITPEAFLREATLVRRESIRMEDKEFERLKQIPPSEMTEDEYEYFKLRSRETPGLMVVDFEKLLLEGDRSQDILLRAGDLITIPATKNFVSVLGMVRDPGNILYEEGLSPQDYIAKAGGYAEKADKGKVRVIRAATGEWVPLDEAEEVEPGDTIWIPEKPERDYWQLFKDVMAVTTQIVTIYLVVDRAVR